MVWPNGIPKSSHRIRTTEKSNDRPSPEGDKAKNNDMVTIPQSGLYSLSYVKNPLPGVSSQIIDFKPEKPEWKLINKETKLMPDYRNFSGIEFISWNKDHCAFRVEFEKADDYDPRIIEDQKKTADVEISGSSGGKCELIIKSKDLSYQDNSYSNISIKDNISTLIPGYDSDFNAVRVKFDEIKNNKTAFENFKKENYHFSDKSLIFSSGNDDNRWEIKINDVDLIPETESDAKEWIFNLTADKLKKNIDKFYFNMNYCSEICKNTYHTTPIKRAFPGIDPDMAQFRDLLQKEYPSLISEIEIAEDLCPKNCHNNNKGSGFDSQNKIPISEPDEEEILDLIYTGEDYKTEFKETLFGINKGDEKSTSIFKAMKTIAAFMNSDGGHLLIGVSDSGDIKGIEGDYQVLNKKQDKNNRDAFRLRFDQEFEKYITNKFIHKIKLNIRTIDDLDVCVINVKASNSPVHITSQNDGSELLYIRRTASTVELKGSDMSQYCISHFNRSF